MHATRATTESKQQQKSCFRLHCFLNGDWERIKGKMIMFDFSSDDPDNFVKLKKSILTLLCPTWSNHLEFTEQATLSNLRIFSKYGTEFTKFEEVRDDDVLFLSCGEDFSNVRLKILHLSSLVSSENSNATVTTTTLENVSPPMITITNIANNKSIKVPLCVSDCTSVEGLFCKSNFPLKFVEDVMLIRNGKELKDTTCWYDPSETSFNVFLLTKKAQYFVKLMMEGGRTIIVDSEAITFESTVAEFKKFVEKRMRVNMSEVNEQRQLVLLRNQQKILDESQSIGMVFPSQSTLSLVFL